MDLIHSKLKYINEKKITFKTNFYERKSRTSNYVLIYCHVFINQKRSTNPISTGVKLPKINWDNNAHP